MRWTEPGGHITGRRAPYLTMLALLVLAACVPLREGDRGTGEEDYNTGRATPGVAWEGGGGLAPYHPAFLQAPPADIASVRLHPAGRPSAPPMIVLGEQEALVLSFDRLGGQSENFRLRLTHRNRDWRRSSLSPYEYIDGFHESTYAGGRPGTGGPPSYVHYRMVIGPGDQFSGGRMGRFLVSGNYLLEVFETGDSAPLFSLPILVSEEEGELSTETQMLYTSATRSDLRSTLLSSDYRYPGDISFPQFDLHAAWVPDRHWGRMTFAGIRNSSAPNGVLFRQERARAWPNNYFRRYLDLRLSGGFGTGASHIRQVRRDTVPPRVILQRDLQAFPGSPPAGGPSFSTGEETLSPRAADYLQVDFSLEPAGDGWRLGDLAGTSPEEVELFVAGDFNGWRLEPRHRMRYDAGEGLWKGRALMKEGSWWYAYLLRGPEGSVRSVGPPASAGEPPHEILTLVYFTDPGRGFDRLLKAEMRR